MSRPATTNLEIIAAVATMAEKIDGFIALADDRDRVALAQRARMESDIAKLSQSLKELMDLRNKGIGVLLVLGGIAGVLGGKMAALFGVFGSWAK